jgi:hypothetical protein
LKSFVQIYEKKEPKKKKNLSALNTMEGKKPWFLAWLHRPQQGNFRHRVGGGVGKKKSKTGCKNFPHESSKIRSFSTNIF